MQIDDPVDRNTMSAFVSGDEGKMQGASRSRCLVETSRARKFSVAFPLLLVMLILQNAEGRQRREDVIAGQVECIKYDGNEKVFSLVCQEFDVVASTDFSMADFITLEKNEIFEGNGNRIVLNGAYSGLLRIRPSSGSGSPSSLDDAPVIRNLHMIGGFVRNNQGFILQHHQRHFIVDSCSSSGQMSGDGSGGICGSRSVGDILITNCSSSGQITGPGAGGVTGATLGLGNSHSNSKIRMTHCHSTGDITGRSAGGICGARAGDTGDVVITHSYSTGRIVGDGSGGFCGWGCGISRGSFRLDQCYSEGEIAGSRSGGLVGRDTAWSFGSVRITNSYSRGDITGTGNTGGIVANTGDEHGRVFIENVYASGKNVNNGGIIGLISPQSAPVHIIMCVVNGGVLVLRNANRATREKNSFTLDAIDGKVYCTGGNDECWDEATIWRAIPNDLPILQFQLLSHIPSAVPSVTPTQTPSNTPTETPTRTPSNTATQTPTRTPSNTATQTPTRTPSNTATETPTRTPSNTATQTPTQTPSNTPSVTPSASTTPWPGTHKGRGTRPPSRPGSNEGAAPAYPGNKPSSNEGSRHIEPPGSSNGKGKGKGKGKGRNNLRS